MKIALLSFISFLLLLVSSATAFADSSCQPIYGGGQNCITIGKVVVNKTVQNPLTGQFVDNLGVSTNVKFLSNQTITFRLAITNTGSTVVPQVIAKDIIPEFTTFVSGPGNFDNNSRTLTYLEFNLNPNETRTQTIQVRVADQLPANETTCRVNQVNITATDTSASSDMSEVCFQKQQVTTKGGLPVLPPSKAQVTPPTGPEMLGLIGLLPAGIGGWFLRKVGKK